MKKNITKKCSNYNQRTHRTESWDIGNNIMLTPSIVKSDKPDFVMLNNKKVKTIQTKKCIFVEIN